MYQETIRMTPYEAQFGKKPSKDWEKYVDTSMINNEKVDLSRIQLHIKEKGSKQADRINKSKYLTKFKVGDQVLIRTYKPSDATQNIIAKFCAVYEGLSRVIKEIGGATYLLQEEGNNVGRGIFNTRQLKHYHSDCLGE